MNIIASIRPGTKPDPAPPERPRGVAPRRLGCAPGTSRDVLDRLTKFAEIEQARGRILVDLGPARVTEHHLIQPVDWTAELKQAADEAQALVEERILYVVVEATAKLDRIANSLTFAQHMLFVPQFEALAEAEREIVDGVAEWIQAKANMAELLAEVA